MGYFHLYFSLAYLHIAQISVSISGEWANFIKKPENIAAIANESILLECRPESNNSVKSWREFITNPAGQTIFIEDTPSDPPNKEIYSLVKPEPGDYHLCINLLALSGGRYCCSTLAPTTAHMYANVIVFGEFS